MDRLPIDGKPLSVEPRQGVEQLLQIGLSRPQARPPLQLRIAQTLPSHADQRGPGPQLNEGAHALGRRGRDAFGEAHWLDHVIAPVIARGDLGPRQAPCEIAQQRQGRRPEGNAAEQLLKLRQHRRHRRRVEGVRHRQASGLDPCGGGQWLEGLNRLERSRDHRVCRSVQGRQRQPGYLGHQILGLGLGSQQRQHPATGWQGLHQAATRRDQLQCVLEVKDTRQVRRHHLANTVTQQQIGLEAPAQPELTEGVAHHKNRRLAEPGLVEQLGVIGVAAEQHRCQGLGQQRIEHGSAAIKSLAEDRMLAVKLLGHAKGLRTLAGE